MVDSELSLCYNKSERHIEEIIDARKKSGEYDIGSQQNNSINCRYAYSTPTTGIRDDKLMRFEETALWISEGDLNIFSDFDPNFLSIGPTDSEITVVRVKREGLQFKNDENNWDMHDEAIPGDGTHLGESPSMVNLATLVGHSVQSLQSNIQEPNEYLVPLSSWDPYDKPHEFPDIQSTIEANCSPYKTRENLFFRDSYKKNMLEIDTSVLECNKIKMIKSENERRSGIAGKISKFIRKHCIKKTKTIGCVISKSEVSNESNQTN